MDLVKGNDRNSIRGIITSEESILLFVVYLRAKRVLQLHLGAAAAVEPAS